MKLLLRTYFPLLLLLLFQFCISPDDVNKTIDDEEEEEEEEEEVVLEDPTDLPFTVNWSINKEGDEIGGSFSPFLHVGETNLYLYSPYSGKGIVSMNKNSQETNWTINKASIGVPYVMKTIGDHLWAMTYDINNPTVIKVDPSDGNVLFEKPSGTFPSGQVDGNWFGLRKRETSLYQVSLETGNDEIACEELVVDNIRNFLFKGEQLVLMVVRGGRNLLSINPNTCNENWEVLNYDEPNFGHLIYSSFAVDLGSSILSVSPNNFILRSPTTGVAEWKYPEGFNNNTLDLTHMLHLESKKSLIYHDNQSGKVVAFNWPSQSKTWESEIQNRDVGQLFLVKERLFLYTKNNFLYEINVENGQTISEREIKELYPFDTSIIPFAINRLEDYFGERYFRIYGDEIYYTTEQSLLVSARLD
ncbi:PQQ-binding-like beta-propeller repeat protein [uncultured Cyclobacterium sp.]|uniref:outer membrane protein assembly factor BamB family protein n=1 Tax=uncultured Cyclobacterium sp. TaxID=453820 RepID=UPI0030ECA07B